MIRKTLLLSILLLSFSFSYADIRVFVDPVSIAAGSTGKVYVKVDGFQKVTGFQLNVTWDVTKLTYEGVGDLGALSMDADENFTAFPSGKLRATWSHPNSDEASLANGSVLFSITFQGICGSTSLVDIVNDGFFTVQFNDTNGDVIPHTVTPGNVTVTGTPCGGAQTVVKVPTLDAQSNSKTCVAIQAGSGFTSITGLTFDINFNASCVAFDEVTGFNSILSGLGAGNFNVSQASGGVVKLSWTSGVATSVGANTKLFDICFTPNGSCCNTTMPITLSNVTITTAGGGTNNLTEAGGLNIKCNTVPDCDPAGLAIIASDHCALPQEIITMDFSVKKFTDVAAMQFSIDWDPACLQLENEGIVIPPSKPVTGLTTGKFNDLGNGCMIVLWDEATGGSVTLPDGTVIFSLKFKVLGSLGASCSVNIGDKCLSSGMEFVNLEGNVIPASSCSGDVEVKACNTELSIVDINVQNSQCAEPCTGAIEFSVTGASAPVITWSQAGLSGNSVSGLCPGSYTVTVTSGASTVSKTYVISANGPAINVSTASVTPSTTGSNGAVDINVSGGTGSFTYQWNTTPPATTQDITGVAPGTYTVTVTDSGSGCKKTLIVTVTDGSGVFSGSISANKFGNYDLSCNESCDGTLTATPAGGVAPYTFKWSFKDATTNSISGVCSGTYTVTITDNAGATVSANYTVLAPPRLIVDFETIYPADDESTDGSIKANPIGGIAPFTYSWTGAVTSSAQELDNLAVGTYNVEITDANGCKASGTEVLTPGGKGCYTGIGAITPNNDGKNDRLLITCVSSSVNRILIFNRWGQKVFEQANYKNGWEGTDENGSSLPDGGYYWVLEVKEASGGTQIYKGAVSIIRSLR